MWRFALCLAASTVLLRAQKPVPPAGTLLAEQLLRPNPGERTLACEVKAVVPALTYRLEYLAGYITTLPMKQFTGHQPDLSILVRVTPKQEQAKPLLLWDKGKLPLGDDQKAQAQYEAQIKGGYFLGEGAYRVEFVMFDEQQRVCRKQWDVELKSHKGATMLEAGQLASYFELNHLHLGRSPGSLTILLNASTAKGNPVLTESIAGMLERLPFRQIHLIAFSLEQRKELFRQDANSADTLNELVESLQNYNPAVVSYGVLKDPAGHRDFLWQLLAKESLRKEPPDAVLFVGFSTFDDSHVFAPPACADSAHKTKYLYFDLEQTTLWEPASTNPARQEQRRRLARRYSRTRLPEMPDAISRVIKECAGKVFHIHSAQDLMTAIGKTEEMLAAK